MRRAADCIFCEIVHGEAPSFRVHEDELTVTFLDLFPVADGHTLVVTREHAENLYEASPQALRAVAANARRVALAIRSELAPDGLGVFQLNGAAAGQTVFHYHMHLIPRNHGDPIAFHGRRQGDPARLAENARRIAGALRQVP